MFHNIGKIRLWPMHLFQKFNDVQVLKQILTDPALGSFWQCLKPTPHSISYFIDCL